MKLLSWEASQPSRVPLIPSVLDTLLVVTPRS